MKKVGKKERTKDTSVLEGAYFSRAVIVPYYFFRASFWTCWQVVGGVCCLLEGVARYMSISSRRWFHIYSTRREISLLRYNSEQMS